MPLIRNDFSKFDKVLWDRYPEKRYKMIADFEERYPVHTLTKEKVVFLLGTTNMAETENMFSYTINYGILFNDYYAIIFDKNNQCIKRFSYTD